MDKHNILISEVWWNVQLKCFKMYHIFRIRKVMYIFECFCKFWSFSLVNNYIKHKFRNNISGLFMIGCGTGKIILKFLPFFANWTRNIKSRETEIYLFVFHLKFPVLEKRGYNFKKKIPTPYPVSYITLA